MIKQTNPYCTPIVELQPLESLCPLCLSSSGAELGTLEGHTIYDEDFTGNN